MTSEPTLIIMAAGMGSRYGGLKQAEKMTQAGEIILDFSLYDAMMAGFQRAVFVIREEHRELFRELVDERAGRFMDIDYAFQRLDDIPAGCTVPEGREKPWGTGHAIYACRDLVQGPFAVINADDYYGPRGFTQLYEYLTAHGGAQMSGKACDGRPEGEGEDGSDAAPVQADAANLFRICMAGYVLRNTITENGHVARGVCEMDATGLLTRITERTQIMRRPEGIAFTEDDGATWTVLPEETLVSMNFWGLPAGTMPAIGEGLEDFFRDVVPGNPLKAEYQLPTVIDGLIREGRAQVQVLPCREKWCGVTYQADREDVCNELQSKKDKGLYPEKLWK